MILPSLLLFIFGTAVGSFLNVVILRLPKEEKLTGRSHCNSCGRQLGTAELVPLLSYLFQRGKCKHCKKSFSPRYFVIETIVGLLFVFAWQHICPADAAGYLLLVRTLFLLCIFLAIFVIDLEHFLILDKIVFPALAVVLVLGLAIDLVSGQNLTVSAGHLFFSLLWALLAAVPFFLVWYFSAGRWLGFGDVKLALLLGAIFGWPLLLVNIMMAIFLGGAVSVFLLAFGGKNLKSQIPFGTFLTLAAALTLFYGPAMLHWYLGLMGF